MAKRKLNLNNDADYEEHIKKLNVEPLADRPIRYVAGQFRIKPAETLDSQEND